jgi:hypothetical protein
MLKSMRGIALLAMLVLALPSARAAQKYTETFTGGANGWTNTLGLGNAVPTVRFTSDLVRIQFDNSPTIPSYVTLLAISNASAGAFTGNYAAAGIQSIGFSMIASGAVPTVLYLELNNLTNFIRRDLTTLVTQTGIWYSLGISLASVSEGNWTVTPTGRFDAVLANVRQLKLYIEQPFGPGTGTQRYQVDNFFLGGLPRASFFPGLTNDNALITWTELRSNLVYALQTTPALEGGWSNVTTFAATGTEHTVTTPPVTNGSPGFYRLLQ